MLQDLWAASARRRSLLIQLTGTNGSIKPTLISDSQAPSTLVGGWLSNQPA